MTRTRPGSLLVYRNSYDLETEPEFRVYLQRESRVDFDGNEMWECLYYLIDARCFEVGSNMMSLTAKLRVTSCLIAGVCP
jgi:hypothetical protein